MVVVVVVVVVVVEFCGRSGMFVPLITIAACCPVVHASLTCFTSSNAQLVKVGGCFATDLRIIKQGHRVAHHQITQWCIAVLGILHVVVLLEGAL